MKETIEKLVSKHTLNLAKAKTLEDYAETENNFTKELLKAINYSQCCTELKDKEEQAFQEWVTAQGYARRMHGYCLRVTENVHITDLRKYYRTLKNL